MLKKKWVIALMALAIICIVAVFLFVSRGKIPSFLAGRPVTFGSYTILIDKIEGNKLLGIKITGKNRKLEAKSGSYTYVPKENALKFNLIDGTAEDLDTKNPLAIRRLTFKEFFMKIRLKPAK
jgi:hypothetical protein